MLEYRRKGSHPCSSKHNHGQEVGCSYHGEVYLCFPGDSLGNVWLIHPLVPRDEATFVQGQTQEPRRLRERTGGSIRGVLTKHSGGGANAGECRSPPARNH